jgi:hypothetical protein
MKHWSASGQSLEVDWSKVPGGTPEQWRAMTWAERRVATGVPEPRSFESELLPESGAAKKAMEKAVVRGRNQGLVRALKERGVCQDCQRRFHPEAMEFDHREDKCFSISQARDVTQATLLEEIAKCDLVCACCHRVRTARRRLGLPAILPEPEYFI